MIQVQRWIRMAQGQGQWLKVQVMAGGPRPDRVAGWEDGVGPGKRKKGRFPGERWVVDEDRSGLT